MWCKWYKIEDRILCAQTPVTGRWISRWMPSDFKLSAFFIFGKVLRIMIAFLLFTGKL